MTDADVEDWYLRYDAACVRRQAARTRVSEVCTLLAEAHLEQQKAEEQVQQIFREKVDLSTGLLDQKCEYCSPCEVIHVCKI